MKEIIHHGSGYRVQPAGALQSSFVVFLVSRVLGLGRRGAYKLRSRTTYPCAYTCIDSRRKCEGPFHLLAIENGLYYSECFSLLVNMEERQQQKPAEALSLEDHCSTAACKPDQNSAKNDTLLSFCINPKPPKSPNPKLYTLNPQPLTLNPIPRNPPPHP